MIEARFTIRRLSPADAAAYVELRREMLGDTPIAFAASPGDDVGLDPAFIAARLAEGGQEIVGAFDGSRLVGAAGVIRSRHAKMAHRAHVWGVYVSPGARGNGVGLRIMEGVAEVARSWPGVTSLGLSVSAATTAARRLYERAGYRAWGIEPGAMVYEGRAYDEVHMVAEL